MSEAPLQSEPTDVEATPPLESTASADNSPLSLNPFAIANESVAESEDAPEAESSDINLSACEFDDPTDFEAAKTQNGRMKKHIAELTDHVKSLDKTVPDNYELNISEDLKESNIQISDDDPMLSSFRGVAKELNLSQDQFNNVANFYIKQEANAQQQLMDESQAHVNNVISQLGETPEAGMARLRSITSRLADAGLSESTINSMQECLSMDVAAIEGIESLFKSQSYAHPVDGNNIAPSLQSRHEAIKAEMTKPEYHTDSYFKSRVVEKLGKLHQEAIKKGISL